MASEGLQVSSAFGNCSNFTCYKVESGIIVDCQSTPNPHWPTERLAPLFHELGVTALITGSIEREAEQAFRAVGIEVVVNESGAVRQAAASYLERTLAGDGEWRNGDDAVVSAQT